MFAVLSIELPNLKEHRKTTRAYCRQRLGEIPKLCLNALLKAAASVKPTFRAISLKEWDGIFNSSSELSRRHWITN